MKDRRWKTEDEERQKIKNRRKKKTVSELGLLDSSAQAALRRPGIAVTGRTNQRSLLWQQSQEELLR